MFSSTKQNVSIKFCWRCMWIVGSSRINLSACIAMPMLFFASIDEIKTTTKEMTACLDVSRSWTRCNNWRWTAIRRHATIPKQSRTSFSRHSSQKPLYSLYQSSKKKRRSTEALQQSSRSSSSSKWFHKRSTTTFTCNTNILKRRYKSWWARQRLDERTNVEVDRPNKREDLERHVLSEQTCINLNDREIDELFNDDGDFPFDDAEVSFKFNRRRSNSFELFSNDFDRFKSINRTNERKHESSHLISLSLSSFSFVFFRYQSGHSIHFFFFSTNWFFFSLSRSRSSFRL